MLNIGTPFQAIINKNQISLLQKEKTTIPPFIAQLDQYLGIT
jgi:hypothetical protein